MTEVSVKVGSNKVKMVNEMIMLGYRLVKMSVEDGHLTLLMKKDDPKSVGLQVGLQESLK